MADEQKFPSLSRAGLDRRGTIWGLLGVAVLLALTFVGSDGLVWFDPALVGYLFGMIFMVFGVIYRYTVWIKRPPTAMLNRRGWDAFKQRKAKNPHGSPVERSRSPCSPDRTCCSPHPNPNASPASSASARA